MACRACTNLTRLSLRTSVDTTNTTRRTTTLLRTAAPSRRIHTSSSLQQTENKKVADQTDLQKPPGPQDQFLARDLARQLASRASKSTQGTYAIYGASELIYKTCTAQAAYEVTAKDREAGKITLGPDGEEVGVGGGMWHDEFKLLPTFSTWSQVTMLHLYLLIVRLRCLDKETYQNWHAQLVDHFFHEAEYKMDFCHGMQSRALRQRNLQDLFQQWRGLILAYDEGLVKGDAVLASAVWRNLFKGKEDVDLRVLAAVVSWMRLCLKNLDHMPDESLHLHLGQVFKWPAKNEFVGVDRPAGALDGLYNGLYAETEGKGEEGKEGEGRFARST